jgi:type IV secretion system protein VirB10
MKEFCRMALVNLPKIRRGVATALFAAGAVWLAQAADEKEDSWRKTEAAAPGDYTVETATKIPLSLINSVSTKNSVEGDRVYLETVFPILVSGKIVIPPGSYVAGTVTQIKRPGRMKGRGELFLRFDSLTLPNGVTRDFRGRVGTLDGRATEELDRTEGKIRSEGDKAGDARTVAEGAGAGASIGAIAGGASGGHYGMGAGIGAAAGATAGLMGVLLTRGPDAVLAKGSTLDMVLDRPLQFKASELEFGSNAMRPVTDSGSGPLPSQKKGGIGSGLPGRRL